MDDEESRIWMQSIHEELSKVPPDDPVTSRNSICRVPMKLLKANPEAYSPRIVSIGPLHHGVRNLQAMEHHKLRCLKSFLKRTSACPTNEETLFMEMLSLAGEVRQCYAENLRIVSDKDLAKIMLVDGCFMIELFIKYSVQLEDPILDNQVVLSDLQHDLVLLENQVPFFVLESLFQLRVVPSHHQVKDPMSSFAFYFFSSLFGLREEAKTSGRWFHLLHLLHACYVPSVWTSPSPSSKPGRGKKRNVPSATALSVAGYELRSSSSTLYDLSDALFSDGLLQISPLSVRDSTDWLFRNLIAFEQFCHGNGDCIASYAFLMDGLIDNEQDVELLVQKSIIINELGELDRVSKLFRSLCNQVVLKDFYFGALFDARFNNQSEIISEGQSGEELVKNKEYTIWMQSMVEELNDAPTGTNKSSIYRVPTALRQVNEDAYNPHIISIGPFHHGQESLQAMEHHKLRYASLFFSRICPEGSSKTLEAVLVECSKEMLQSVDKVRGCYAESVGFSSYKLAKIMLLDGCFIIELFIRCHGKKHLDDPILGNAMTFLTLQRDLALLENQIPYTVLRSLFAMVEDSDPPYSLNSLALGFFEYTLNLKEGSLQDRHRGQSCKHLLDLLLGCYLPSVDAKPKSQRDQREEAPAHSASALAEAGITFQKASSDALMDVSFENGVFQIPSLCIHESTHSLFRNFIAFEQCCPVNNGNLFTAYMVLLDHLIDRPEDVKLLEEAKIIKNSLGVRDDISNLFNDICKNVVYEDYYFTDLCHRVDTRYKASWHRLIASFKHTYCHTPWKCISLFVGTMILIFTALQTIYTLLGYYNQG